MHDCLRMIPAFKGTKLTLFAFSSYLSSVVNVCHYQLILHALSGCYLCDAVTCAVLLFVGDLSLTLETSSLGNGSSNSAAFTEAIQAVNGNSDVGWLAPDSGYSSYCVRVWNSHAKALTACRPPQTAPDVHLQT